MTRPQLISFQNFRKWVQTGLTPVIGTGFKMALGVGSQQTAELLSISTQYSKMSRVSLICVVLSTVLLAIS